MEVRRVGEAGAAWDPPAWDAAVAGAGGATFCHLASWRPIMEDVLGHRTLYLEAVDGTGAVRAVLPLVEVRSRLFGHYLLSMPFLNYGGPVGDADGVRALATRAVSEAERLGVDLLELRGRRAGPDPLPPALRVTERKVTVVLDLPGSSEELWKDRFRSKLRSQIRKPMKEGLTTRFGPDQVEAFYDVFARNMRDLGTPVLPLSFFEALREGLDEAVVFGCVLLGEEPVAAGCGFRWGGEFEMTWASSVAEHNRLAPNMLLYWSFMERMIEEGVPVFNFGRCTPGSGTHRFKLQWESREEPLPWLQWSDDGVAATPSPDRPLFRLATGAWSRLPLAVTNRLGPPLARRLP